MGLAASIIEEGQDPREFMLGYAEHLRYLMAATVGGESALETLLEKEQKQYLETCGLFALEDYLRRLELVSNGAQSLRESPQPWITLEATFLRLASMDRSVDLTNLLDRIEGSLSGNQSATVSRMPPQPDPKPSSGSPETGTGTAAVSSTDRNLPPADAYETEMGEGQKDPGGGYQGKGEGKSSTPEQAETVRRHWNDIIEEVRRRKVTLGAFLAEAELKGIEENKLVLAFAGENHNFHVNMVNRHMDLIRESTREVVGHAYGVKCIKVEGGKKKQDLNQKLLERMCEQDPNLKKIVDTFGAQLEDGPGGRPGM
jgi:DNA polymerase-3 subunit gamma/tau